MILFTRTPKKGRLNFWKPPDQDSSAAGWLAAAGTHLGLLQVLRHDDTAAAAGGVL